MIYVILVSTSYSEEGRVQGPYTDIKFAGKQFNRILETSIKDTKRNDTPEFMLSPDYNGFGEELDTFDEYRKLANDMEEFTFYDGEVHIRVKIEEMKYNIPEFDMFELLFERYNLSENCLKELREIQNQEIAKAVARGV